MIEFQRIPLNKRLLYLTNTHPFLEMQVASLLHAYIWSYLHSTPSRRLDALKLGNLAESADLDPVTSVIASETIV